jgi:hypothetical protein
LRCSPFIQITLDYFDKEGSEDGPHGRCTELNTDRKLLVKQLRLDLPSRPPPRITAPPTRGRAV